MKVKFRAMLTALIAIGLSACASFQRSPRSGYADDGEARMSVDRFFNAKKSQDVNRAEEELGLLGRPLNDEQTERVRRRIALHHMEDAIASEREKKQYYSVKAFLKNDSQRMAFLNLPGYTARARWIKRSGVLKQEDQLSDQDNKLIDSKDIAMGMTQNGVRESWGDPDAVEVAGDPIYGYKRWIYHRYVSGSEGYQKQMRTVYFEGGRVVGWQTR